MVVIGIEDHRDRVVVLQAAVAPQIRRDDPLGLVVVHDEAEVDVLVVVQQAHLRALRRRRALDRLAHEEIPHDLGGCPDVVVHPAVENGRRGGARGRHALAARRNDLPLFFRRLVRVRRRARGGGGIRRNFLEHAGELAAASGARLRRFITGLGRLLLRERGNGDQQGQNGEERARKRLHGHGGAGGRRQVRTFQWVFARATRADARRG